MFIVQFSEKMYVVIPSPVSFASIGCIRDIVALDLRWSRAMSLHLRLVSNKTDTPEECPGVELVGQ